MGRHALIPCSSLEHVCGAGCPDGGPWEVPKLRPRGRCPPVTHAAVGEGCGQVSLRVGRAGPSLQVPAAGSASPLRARGLGPACPVCPLQTPCVSWLSLTELPFPSHTPCPIQPPPSLQSFPTSFSPRLLQTPTHGPACRCPGGQGPGSTLRSNGARYACTRWTGRRQVPGQS